MVALWRHMVSSPALEGAIVPLLQTALNEPHMRAIKLTLRGIHYVTERYRPNSITCGKKTSFTAFVVCSTEAPSHACVWAVRGNSFAEAPLLALFLQALSKLKSNRWKFASIAERLNEVDADPHHDDLPLLWSMWRRSCDLFWQSLEALVPILVWLSDLVYVILCFLCPYFYKRWPLSPFYVFFSLLSRARELQFSRLLAHWQECKLVCPF